MIYWYWYDIYIYCASMIRLAVWLSVRSILWSCQKSQRPQWCTHDLKYEIPKTFCSPIRILMQHSSDAVPATATSIHYELKDLGVSTSGYRELEVHDMIGRVCWHRKIIWYMMMIYIIFILMTWRTAWWPTCADGAQQSGMAYSRHYTVSSGSHPSRHCVLQVPPLIRTL